MKIYQDWQLNPKSLETKTIQLWTASGVMLTAQLTKTEAEKMVSDGRCFVITSQAIGFKE
jgi:hypothetical protein